MDSHEKQSPQRFVRYAAMLIMLLTLGVGQMWADKTIWEWKLYYWDGSNNRWLGDDNNTGDLDFGVVNSSYYWKGAWAKTSDKSSGTVSVYYVEPDGSQNNFGLTYQNCWDDCYNKFWKNESGCNIQLASASVYKNNPGVNTIQFYVQIDGEDKLTPKATYTLPGFTTTSTSKTIVSALSSNKSETISFGQHYGTALTTGRCSITGTNASEFAVTGISETGVTVKFTPSSAGVKSATLTITDEHSKTCTISLTGKSKVTVTYSKGSASGATGSTVYDDKVYGVNLTLKNSGSFSRTGYTQTAWNTNEAGTGGTNYALQATYSTESDLALYPTWTAKTTTVTLKPNGATSGSDQTVTATYDAAMPLVTTASAAIALPSKTGYTLLGYWDATSAGTQYYAYGGTPAALSSCITWNKEDATKNLYARWQANQYTLTLYKNDGSGTSTSATATYDATITVTAPTRTGYTFTGYWTSASGDGTKIIDTDGHFVNTVVSGYVASGRKWQRTSNTNLYARWTANSYDVTLKPNGATTGSDQVVRATFDAAMPTTTKTSAALVAPEKTGYTFGGYSQNSDGTGTLYYAANLSSANAWNQDGNVNIYAKWTANSYTVTLNVDEDHKGTTAGATTSQTVYYDDATTTVPNRPTAEAGYGLDGYYTDHNGEGIKLINADGTWIASVEGYTDSNKKWVHDGDVTLYAYYKIGTITDLTFSPAAVVAPSTSIIATPTFDPTPTGTHIICWEVQYSNGTPLPSQPTFTRDGDAVSFDVPAASATYRLQATLKTGNNCGSGTELCVYSKTFQVAGEHTVTVRYQDASGRTLKDTIHITGKPLEWTTLGDITPPTITGYKFDHWDAGDGVTIKNGDSDPVTTTTTSSIQIKAVYDGTLTAVYAKKKLIFFNNTLGWSDVYVYFYNTDKYWNDAYGSGAKQGQEFDGDKKPYWEQEHGHMTQIEGTDIWYFDYEAAGYSTRANVVFTEDQQHGYQWFNYTKAARRSDHISDLQMFVPLTTKTHDLNNTKYYNSGYWMNYPENTGYSLLIYNQKTKTGATKLYEFPFEFTEDFTMPMELVVDLEAGQTYGFEIKRADGTYYSNTETMTANTTNWSMSKDQSSYCGLQTTVAGNYTFKFYYSSSSYRMDVTYPVAINDYRIVYTDLATWSKDAHTASWSHPSRVITKNSSATETKKDTVSFFWSYGSTPAIKYQTCTAVAAGSASWSAGTAIDVSSYSSVLTKKGVYNFIFEQPAGGASISLVKVEPYTGKYYIRTDCAGSSKWVNYRSTDHEMTYSEYTEKNHGYSHYYTHWVTTGQNVKFVIANDYSPCISDTLVEDKGTTIASITTEGNANAGRLNSGNASIRFMWKQADNKVSRAYISGSTTVSDRFLVLEGDSKMYDENGNPLSISGLNANEINLVDDQNFVYERTIKVNTGAKAKLTAKYNGNVQYFRGGSGSTAADSVELLGGDAAGQHTMRIVYDFKTNRLVTAYVPSGTIEDDIAIHADLMIVREHQEAGQQLLFTGGSLSEVETVYGVMRFNRWTLNNKEKTGDHSVVGDPKSPYERALYWISFPFDVNLSDVFGFGTYGTHWIIMEYDGAERAKKGYWKDSDGFWKHVTNRTDKVLESGKGYVLGLDLDLMKDDNTVFWANEIEQVELFFPSADEVGNIEATTVTTSAGEHLYDAAAHPGHTDDRTYKDSHWNMIGVPSYANYGTTLTSDGSTTVNWATPTNADLPYLYEWNMVDNTYTVQSGTTYPFQSMHAYMVQYHGDLYWSMASATPPVSPIVARRMYAEKPQNVEFRLALSQNDMMIDQTFVKLSNDENVSANFVFDEDLSKEYNANKANIYTVIEGNTPAAGNTMPMSEQTTVIPVGVKIATNGEYTFAMPDGTSGIGVTLIDNETGIRSNLALEDYIVNIEAATYENRFYLEISPIKNTPTDIENTDAMNSNVRKVMVDGLLYIIKDGKVFDAHGARVK